MEPNDLRVPGADGLSLHVLEWSREGVPMLLVHGYGNEAHIWDDFAPVVAPYYRTLALDQRGHGDSDWDPERRYGHESLLADLEATADALELSRFVLVGHSLGGRISTLFAGAHPERLAGLVLVDIGPEVDARGSTRIQTEVASNQEPTFGSVEEYARTLSLLYPAGRPQAIERMARYGLRQRDDGRFELKMDPALRGIGQRSEEEIRREVLSPEAQWEALAKISCPTLVVRGAASDILSPDTADRMVDDVLPNGRLAVVPQAGHSVMTDNPDGFFAALSSFLLEEE